MESRRGGGAPEKDTKNYCSDEALCYPGLLFIQNHIYIHVLLKWIASEIDQLSTNSSRCVPPTLAGNNNKRLLAQSKNAAFERILLFLW